MDREWKPGYKTSECWITVFVLLIAATVTVCVVLYGKDLWAKGVGLIVDILAILKARGFAADRAKLKELWLKYGHILDGSTVTPEPAPAPAPVPVPVPVPQPQIIITPAPTPAPIVIRPETLLVTTKTVRGGGTITTIKLSPSPEKDDEKAE